MTAIVGYSTEHASSWTSGLLRRPKHAAQLVRSVDELLQEKFPTHVWKDGYLLHSKAQCKRQVLHCDFDQTEHYKALIANAEEPSDWANLPVTALAAYEFGTRLVLDVRPFLEAKKGEMDKLNLKEIYLYPQAAGGCFSKRTEENTSCE